MEQTDKEPLDRVGLTWLLGLSIPSIAWGRGERVRDPEIPPLGLPQKQLLPSHPSCPSSTWSKAILCCDTCRGEGDTERLGAAGGEMAPSLPNLPHGPLASPPFSLAGFTKGVGDCGGLCPMSGKD